MNWALPLASVRASPLVPMFGPEVTRKWTVTPWIGLPLSSCTVPVRVCGCPTLFVADVGESTTPAPTTAAPEWTSRAAKKMLSSVDGFVVLKVRLVSPLLANGRRL